jgi:hypothetical protein
MVDSTLSDAHAPYVQSLFDDVRERRAPVFSASVFQLSDDGDVLMTGRLFTPFTRPGGDVSEVIVSLQLFKGPDIPLPAVSFVHEIRRDLIAVVPALCAQLEDARRYYQVARHLGRRTLADEMGDMARSLAGNALIALPCMADPHVT